MVVCSQRKARWCEAFLKTNVHLNKSDHGNKHITHHRIFLLKMSLWQAVTLVGMSQMRMRIHRRYDREVSMKS